MLSDFEVFIHDNNFPDFSKCQNIQPWNMCVSLFVCYYAWTVEFTMDNVIEEVIEDLVGKGGVF